jgi:hypothetical protein
MVRDEVLFANLEQINVIGVLNAGSLRIHYLHSRRHNIEVSEARQEDTDERVSA